MSRLFEYLKKVDSQTEEQPSGKDGLHSDQAHNSAEIRQILSVLQLPETTGAAAPRQALDLAQVPVTEIVVQPEDRLFFHSDPTGPAADRLRLLRMRLRELWNAGKLKNLLITSPCPPMENRPSR